MEPIRVLQIFTIMNRGGAETMIMNYYRNIDREKVQFDFIVHRQERGAYDDEIEMLGGRIYRLLPVHPIYFVAYKKQIRDFFDKHLEYRIIHGNTSELGYFIYKEAYRRKIPVIIAHAHLASMSLDIKSLFRIYFRLKMKKYITDMFSCGIDAGRFLFGKKNQGNITILKNAIDKNRFVFNLYIRERLKKDLNIENKFIIGHIGRFDKQKNHRFLIEVFSKIYERSNDIRLLLIGKGKNENKIRQLVKKLKLEDSVLFLGTRSDVNEILNTFDLFVFPSLYEGLPVALIEAQANGLKCIISDRISNESILTNDVKVLSLKAGEMKWSNEILSLRGKCKHNDNSQLIVKKGFDINMNAKWLEDYYLSKAK